MPPLDHRAMPSASFLVENFIRDRNDPGITDGPITRSSVSGFPRRGLLPSQRDRRVEHLRLDLVVTEFDLPSLVVERDDLVGRVALRVAHRRKDQVRAEALSLVANGANDEGRRQRRILLSRLGRYLDF